jgi:RNA polymerase sigma-70 factor, ECF subfamily
MVMQTLNDENLIRRCQQGEKEAFQKLISKYHPIIYRFLMGITEDEHLAEDLTQDTFLKIIRNIEKFDIYGKAKFSTYLITVAKNCYIDHIRKTKGIRLDLYNVDDFENLNTEKNIEDIVLDRLNMIEINSSLERLTEEQRIVIKLKYIEGLTLKEIGDLLNVEPKTVKSRIHNGIVKLRQLLKERGVRNEE